jgi:flagellar biogenesis protein FliO
MKIFNLKFFFIFNTLILYKISIFAAELTEIPKPDEMRALSTPQGITLDTEENISKNDLARLSPEENLPKISPEENLPTPKMQVSKVDLEKPEANKLETLSTTEKTTAEKTTAEKPITDNSALDKSSDNDLIKNSAIALFMLIGFAGAGIFLVKLKKGSLKIGQKSPIELVSSLTLSPKRQIILVRIKGKEFALASTEMGIQVIGEINEALSSFDKSNVTNTGFTVHPKQIPLHKNTNDKIIQPREEAEETQKEISIQKNNLIRNAFAGIKKSSNKAQDDSQEGELKNSQLKDNQLNYKGTKTSTLSSPRQTSSFPKYLAKSFESQNTEQNREDSVEDVTNIIRRKLKEIGNSGGKSF